MDATQRRLLLDRVRRDAAIIAAHFGLSYRAIECEHPRVRSRYGVCYSDGLIKIRLWHVNTGKPLKYSSIIDTLCHELAHLRHFNHGPQFRAFFMRLLRWARTQGIYCPSPRRRARATPTLRPAPQAAVSQRDGVPVFFTRSATSAPVDWRSVLSARAPRPSGVEQKAGLTDHIPLPKATADSGHDPGKTTVVENTFASAAKRRPVRGAATVDAGPKARPSGTENASDDSASGNQLLLVFAALPPNG